MRRSRRSHATWLGRFLRGWLPDRNPLRRRTDRLEAAVFAALFVMACAIAPFVAAAASSWENGISQREMHAQQATCREVKATLLDDAQERGNYPALTAQADAMWTAPDGRGVTGVLQVPAGAVAGRVIWIWTDRSGRVITPLLRNQIPSRDDLAATVAVVCVGAVILLAGLAVHGVMSRRRMIAWGIDWLATEPRWNSRHGSLGLNKREYLEPGVATG
jgi:hypothetical protein